MSNVLRVGIVGCGGIAEVHREAVEHLELFDNHRADPAVADGGWACRWHAWFALIERCQCWQGRTEASDLVRYFTALSD